MGTRSDEELWDELAPEQRTEISRSIAALQADPAWAGIYKRLLLRTYKELQVPLGRADDLIGLGVLEMAEEHGFAIEAYGGVQGFVDRALPYVLRIKERLRKRKEARNARLTEESAETLVDESLGPDQRYLEAELQRSMDRTLERAVELATPYACARALLEAMRAHAASPASIARERGFEKNEIDSERHRVKRLLTQAARELELIPESNEEEAS